ncbi:MAG: RagB/SusD family nutrient uptake outer membrane protein [Bacteroidota bacterium]
MKRLINNYSLILLITVVSVSSCKKEYGNLNSPTIEDYLKNASKDQLNGLVIGAVSGMRNNEGTYLDAVGVIGREIYRFSNADPRFATDLLGQNDLTLNNTGFYLTNPWGSRYRTVKNCNVLIEAATNSTLVPDNQKKGYTGFAKTLKAYELLLNLNLTYSNGIRVDVSDPDKPGPILDYDASIAAIASLLDEGKTDLTGAEISFELTPGFSGFDDAEGLIKFNRALAARVDVYREQWPAALSDLALSFFDLSGDFSTGVSEVFSTGSGDQLNSAFFPQNQNGEVRLAHPTYVTDMEANDDRISKATLRTAAASYGGLSSDRDEWVYTSSTAPIPVIRNEELILIYAEAKIQSDNLADGQAALNVIRQGHNLPAYSGAITKDALINEMLKQRRYSLFFEGHRWIDMRRYDKLSDLPIDRPGDDVWSAMPIPSTENP